MLQTVTTSVYGVAITVTLDIDLSALANMLGAKAAINSSRRSVLAKGYIKAKVSQECAQRVNDARYARNERLRAERLEKAKV